MAGDEGRRLARGGAGPGKAYTAKEQAEMLFRITGKEPKFFGVPVAFMDFIIGLLETIGKVIPAVGVPPPPLPPPRQPPSLPLGLSLQFGRPCRKSGMRGGLHGKSCWWISSRATQCVNWYYCGLRAAQAGRTDAG